MNDDHHISYGHESHVAITLIIIIIIIKVINFFKCWSCPIIPLVLSIILKEKFKSTKLMYLVKKLD